jgi:phage terminase large subunit
MQTIPTKEQIRTLREKIKSDPVYFAEEILKSPVWEKEKEILEAVRDYPEVSVRSCHASGKTYTAARVVNWWMCSYDDAVVITTAPTFRQVEQLLWREIRSSVAGKAIYPSSAILNTKIELGDKWFALGLSADKSEQFQGFHSPHLLVVVDEASGVSEEIFTAVDGLAPSRVLLIGNPTQNSGRFANSFKSPTVKKIQISALDTPNVKAQALVIPGLITQADIERFKVNYGEDSDVYRVRVLGEFPRADVETLISVDDVSKAMDRESKTLAQWELKMGVDPARFGDDRTAFVIRQMETVTHKFTFSGQDTMQIAGQVIRLAKEHRVRPENINVDVIGIGAGIVDRLREQAWPVCAVNVAETAKDTEHYMNQRAELYDTVRQWIKTATLPKDDDFYEMANIKYKFTSTGKLQMESKQDMKKRGLPSPDIADALMLTFANPRGIISNIASPLPENYYPEIGL